MKTNENDFCVIFTTSSTHYYYYINAGRFASFLIRILTRVFFLLFSRGARLLHSGKGHSGHTVRVRHRAVRVLRTAGHPVRHHTRGHVRAGAAGGARDAHVPVAQGQEERGGILVGPVARSRLRHQRRTGRAPTTARGRTKAQQQLQGPDIVQGHGPRVHRRHGAPEFPVVLRHQRAHILRRVHIR